MSKVLRKIRDTIKSIPVKIKKNREIRQQRYDDAVMKEYEKVKDIPAEPADYTNPVFRAQTNAIDVRYRRDPAYKAEIDKKVKESGL